VIYQLKCIFGEFNDDESAFRMKMKTTYWLVMLFYLDGYSMYGVMILRISFNSITHKFQ